MPQVIQCPSCGRMFAFKPQLAGRRVKCPRCTAPFQVPDEAGTPDDDLNADEAAADPRAAVPAPRPRRDVDATAPLRRPRPTGRPRVWSPAERFWLRTGAAILVFGVLAQILPRFGLQVRKLSQLGDSAATVGTALAVIGGAITTLVLVRPWLSLGVRHVRRLLRIGAAAALALVGILIVVAWWSRPSRPQLPPPGGPALATHPPGPRGPAAPGPPPLPGPPAAPAGPTLAELHARFGSARVVRIVIRDVRDLDVSRTLQPKLAMFVEADAKPTWRLSQTGDEARLLLAPVVDLDALVRAIDFGTVDSVDATERIVTVTADRGRFLAVTREPRDLPP